MFTKHTIGHIDYHVADACNLACKFCTHYSNFKGPANFVSVDDARNEWRQWSERIKPERVHLIGGEPLLNPNVVELVKLAFEVWTESTICLYSNGLLLNRHPGLKEALSGGRFVLGLHYGDDRDRQTELMVREFFGCAVHIDIVDGINNWLQFYRIGTNGEPIPFDDGDQRSSWQNCAAAQQRCFVLRDNKLWKCPQVAYADRAGVSHWFEDYRACSPSDDLAEWLQRTDESCCKRCPSRPQSTTHGAKHMQVMVKKLNR